jgi:hypothetical protein
MTSAEDEDTQKAGIVIVCINMETSIGPGSFDFGDAQKMHPTASAIPIRFSGVHIMCQEDSQLKSMLCVIIKGVERATRVRMRAHFGE